MADAFIRPNEELYVCYKRNQYFEFPPSATPHPLPKYALSVFNDLALRHGEVVLIQNQKSATSGLEVHTWPALITDVMQKSEDDYIMVQWLTSQKIGRGQYELIADGEKEWQSAQGVRKRLGTTFKQRMLWTPDTGDHNL